MAQGNTHLQLLLSAPRRCIVTFEDDISWGLRSLASEAPSAVDVFTGMFVTHSPRRSTKMTLLHSLLGEFGSGSTTPFALVDYSCQDQRTTTAWEAQRYGPAVTGRHSNAGAGG